MLQHKLPKRHFTGPEKAPLQANYNVSFSSMPEPCHYFSKCSQRRCLDS